MNKIQLHSVRLLMDHPVFQANGVITTHPVAMMLPSRSQRSRSMTSPRAAMSGHGVTTQENAAGPWVSSRTSCIYRVIKK